MCGMVVDVEYLEEIIDARDELDTLISLKDCAPIMLRLAWQEAATYDAQTDKGGPDGSIRFREAYSHPANKGLKYAIDICEEVKSNHPMITYADLYQLAGAVAVRVALGPTVPFNPGRKDSTLPTPEYGKLLPTPSGDATHLRRVFSRMGLSDKDIVVLSGGHTLGRAHRERSGFEGPWTSDPLLFDNSYYVELLKDETRGLLKLPSDIALLSDPDFRSLVEHYAKRESEFFTDYAISHEKFSELGFTLNPVTKENIMKLRDSIRNRTRTRPTARPSTRPTTRSTTRPTTRPTTNSYSWWWVGGTVAAAVVLFLYLA